MLAEEAAVTTTATACLVEVGGSRFTTADGSLALTSRSTSAGRDEIGTFAKTSLHFRGTVPVHHDYDAVLRRMPGELALHYKVWELLLATQRHDEAHASYRRSCRLRRIRIADARHCALTCAHALSHHA